MPSEVAKLRFPDSLKMLTAYLRTLRGEYSVDIKRCRDQRTKSQNDCFHAWLPDIARHMSECFGEFVDVYDVKAFLKDRFLRRSIISHETGEIIGYFTRGTSTLDVDEMTEFMRQVRGFCLDYLRFDPDDRNAFDAPKDAPKASSKRTTAPSGDAAYRSTNSRNGERYGVACKEA